MPRKPMTISYGTELMQGLTLAAVMKVYPKKKVRQVLRATGTDSLRTRLLPASLVVYLVLMLALCAEASVRENLRLIIEPLRRRLGFGNTKVPVGSAITKARRRLGPAPLRELFETTARPLARPSDPGCYGQGFRIVAVDGTSVDIQATDANRERFGIHCNQHGAVGYPQLKASVLLECGSRLPFACACGGVHEAEGALLDSIQSALSPDMVLLADRAYYSFERWRDCQKRAGALLWRIRNTNHLRREQALDDGSYLTTIRPSTGLIKKGRARKGERMTVRIIEYAPVFEDGSRGGPVRLITDLLDARRYPGQELALLYAQRWQIETGFGEWKSHLRGRDRVLRSQLPELVEQEFYGFLLAYYVVRATMLEASRKGGVAPTELSFVHAVSVIRRKISFPPSGCEKGKSRV